MHLSNAAWLKISLSHQELGRINNHDFRAHAGKEVSNTINSKETGKKHNNSCSAQPILTLSFTPAQSRSLSTLTFLHLKGTTTVLTQP